jgi:hypothetical protein
LAVALTLGVGVVGVVGEGVTCKSTGLLFVSNLLFKRIAKSANTISAPIITLSSLEELILSFLHKQEDVRPFHMGSIAGQSTINNGV